MSDHIADLGSGDVSPLPPERLRQLLKLTQDQFTMPQFTVTSYGMRVQLPIIRWRDSEEGFFFA